MSREFFLRGSVLVVLGSSLAGACSEDATPASVGGSSGSGGAGGRAGSSGAPNSGGSSAGVFGGTYAGEAGFSGTAGDAGAAGAAGAAGSDAGGGAFTLSSPAFDNNPGCGPGEPAAAACDLFPNENTGLGDSVNVSPAMDWTGAPAGTLSFAIALHDLVYMPQGEPYTHWVMWNIPSSAPGLPASLPAGAAPGVPDPATRQVSFANDDRFTGSGACGNVYEFVLYALDAVNFEAPDAGDPDAVESALAGSSAVLATTHMRARSDPAGPCN